MTYLVGIDSGGTHTNIRIIAPDGQKRTVPEIDKSLTSNRSNTELRHVFEEILTTVQATTLGQATSVWINAAGYSASTRTRFERILRAATSDFKGCIGISNDAVGLLLALDPEVVVVIAGTGSVAMGRDHSGAVVTRGGDEWVVADYGSAFWLGLNGIRAAYQALEGGADTSLLSCLSEHYSPLKADEAPRDIRTAVGEIARRLASLGTDTKPTIASFAKQVTRQAELGDDEAQSIVRRAVDELAGAAARVYRELATRETSRTVAPRFLISGSVAYNSRFYAETFSASLDQFLFDVRDSSQMGIEIKQQMNGLTEAAAMAKRLADGDPIPSLDRGHPHSVIEGGPDGD